VARKSLFDSVIFPLGKDPLEPYCELRRKKYARATPYSAVKSYSSLSEKSLQEMQEIPDKNATNRGVISRSSHDLRFALLA
jgi:hypothetical protein